MRRFEAFVSSIFLYNSELWCLDAKLSKKVDVFQRIFLRQIINVTKLDKISNINLYKICQTEPWSVIIQRRRFRFLGHLLRSDDQIPAKKSLNEFLRPVQRDPGRPKTTWWSLVKNDLKLIGIDNLKLNELEIIARDRRQWKELGRAMSATDGKR